MGTAGPKFRSYHIVDEERGKRREECYLQHIILCCDEWMIYKRKFIGSMVRRFAALCDLEIGDDLINDLEEALKIAIAHHDIGKLSREYQNGEWYRHEIIGAHAVYNILFNYLTDKPYKDLLCALISAAVYLHHEAIQIAHKWFKLRSPTFEYLNSKIGPLFFTFDDVALQAFEAINEFSKLSIGWRLPKAIGGKEIVRTISNIISLIDGMPRVNATRLCLASAVLLISEVDNRAAERGRV
ncbi:MAG: CRISPR-associated endonuclease Cas3'' [Desulfurococcaceae archaeon]